LRSIIGHDIHIELEEKHRFGWSLGASDCALWLIGLLGGWWLAGKAIRPIQSISQTATRIADGNLSERINTTGTDSELDQLSHVLNHTFNRLNATLEQQRQFTSDASHELRPPLTILLSESQRMSKSEITHSTKDYQEAFSLCHDAATRMRRWLKASYYSPAKTVETRLKPSLSST
jgi:signal transduction histidine kinase